jgi:hypothetical protein
LEEHFLSASLRDERNDEGVEWNQGQVLRQVVGQMLRQVVVKELLIQMYSEDQQEHERHCDVRDTLRHLLSILRQQDEESDEVVKKTFWYV